MAQFWWGDPTDEELDHTEFEKFKKLQWSDPTILRVREYLKTYNLKIRVIMSENPDVWIEGINIGDGDRTINCYLDNINQIKSLPKGYYWVRHIATRDFHIMKWNTKEWEGDWNLKTAPIAEIDIQPIVHIPGKIFNFWDKIKV